MREETRNPAKLILVALGQKSLQDRGAAELDGKPMALLSFVENGDEFRIDIDRQSKLPVQSEILEDDPLEGDSSYTVRYGDWRKIDGVMLPFSLRYELNGRELQEEQIKSIPITPRSQMSLRHPGSVRNQKSDVTPIASQWILRRVAGNVSYQDWDGAGHRMGAAGARRAQNPGSSHATIVVEMSDHLVAIEGPLYEARTAPVVKSIKEHFPGKPIRYVIPTHHHLDHAGGIRAFMAEGATLIVPFNAKEFYTKVAHAPHTRKPDSLERNKSAFVLEIRWRPENTDRRCAPRRSLSAANRPRRRSRRGLSARRKAAH